MRWGWKEKERVWDGDGGVGMDGSVHAIAEVGYGIVNYRYS